MDDGFCGLDPRPWIRFSKVSVKESDYGYTNDMNLIYFEELRTLSQMNLKLTLEPSDKPVLDQCNNNSKLSETKRFKRPYWIRGPLPQLASFRCVSGSVPKIKVRNQADLKGANQHNPVFRSNSFSYKKCSNGKNNVDKIWQRSSATSNKVKNKNYLHLKYQN